MLRKIIGSPENPNGSTALEHPKSPTSTIGGVRERNLHRELLPIALFGTTISAILLYFNEPALAGLWLAGHATLYELARRRASRNS